MKLTKMDVLLVVMSGVAAAMAELAKIQLQRRVDRLEAAHGRQL